MIAVRTSVLAGVGSRLPAREVTSEEVAAHIGGTARWIHTRTGIRSRHVVDPGVTTGDLAVAAGRAALASARADSVSAVVVATTSPDRPCPGTAPAVAARLGLAGAAALDVQAVCAGFVYALGTAQGLIAAGTADSVLVIGADVMSPLRDPSDPGVFPLFGDGAGAVVLRAGREGEPGALGPTVLGADGRGRDLITVPGGGCEEAVGATGATSERYLRMRGREVFARAVECMEAASRQALDAAGWKADEVDRVVPHQANARIITMLGEQLGIAADRILTNIEDVGNTSAASVPLLLDHAHRDGGLAPGQRVLLTAFGGGLAWGATTLVWPRLDRPT
ncbi:beta-ketoacyl-ACP synthase 3 [Streptantibioticus cattleyicolor]|uniref:Beta-ketoacyl-[acyl-carrier-protein] synthase III n=1 Tax=Streptantibioticus cattleyicolor (strain ATCC 35852 / DSM 46488 / JCM 4925 / NBRC 14057 / NRRL 8057) TaxID=1003195 RepID=F8JMI6_STREN|nr:beta-ketoacyl-ACP synthase 3 [Streptantibioticus cattleyicolor]AEW99332.1 3-oxoacyl-[acyl-carrier-protein] synthase [Streptantibioticus cattleyicolor NRRL 8057 = DSM 46488]CCB71628.1 3-oxoacyl-[acyl-carrier-protein] synthase 3 protein 3 [Streptantibioticus cattleyicolor NRRL 8057 = DSM 46488]